MPRTVRDKFSNDVESSTDSEHRNVGQYLTGLFVLEMDERRLPGTVKKSLLPDENCIDQPQHSSPLRSQYQDNWESKKV